MPDLQGRKAFKEYKAHRAMLEQPAQPERRVMSAQSAQQDLRGRKEFKA